MLIVTSSRRGVGSGRMVEEKNMIKPPAKIRTAVVAVIVMIMILLRSLLNMLFTS